MGTPDHVGASEQCDAAGQHGAAIDALAHAVREGSVEAMTRLGKRLLVGDRAPYLPRDGVRFLLDAVAAGGAEAAERLAVVAATGVYRAPNWNEALGALILSAERGWIPSRAQLCVLAADRTLASEAASEVSVPVTGSEIPSQSRTTTIWRQLAGTIELPAAGDTRPSDILCAEPAVKAFPDLVTNAVCDWLIKTARPKLSRARVYDSNTARDAIHCVFRRS